MVKIKIKKLEESIHQLRVWGRSRDSEKMFKRAKAMEKRLERIERLEKPQLKGRKMNLELAADIRGGDDVLFVENLTKSFEELKLFENLNFELHRSDKAAIIGDNGTGKSTILRIIMGEISADQGNTRIGTNIYPAYYRQEFEGFNPDDDLITALQRETAVTNSRARDMLASFLFTGEDVFKKVKQLSGGEKQLVLIARALMQDTGYLIMDEPTSHLDFKNKNLLMREIKKLTRNSNTGVIMALHDPNLAMKYCDRVIIVKEGSIMADGDTDEIMTGRNLGDAYGIDIKINEKSKGIEIALPEI